MKILFPTLDICIFSRGLTPVLTERAKVFLAQKEFPAEARQFIDVHATEDIGHAKALRNLIMRVVSQYPSAAESIEYGFDCFSCAYPLPIWNAALDAAKKESTHP